MSAVTPTNDCRMPSAVGCDHRNDSRTGITAPPAFPNDAAGLTSGFPVAPPLGSGDAEIALPPGDPNGAGIGHVTRQTNPPAKNRPAPFNRFRSLSPASPATD